MNYFKFRKVGQGLFYTGSLCDGSFNFVYDCGGSKEYINHAIDKYCKELEEYGRAFDRENIEIDFLVLSHLHLDHFVGIMELSKRHHINKIYLPYLDGNKYSIAAIILYAIFSGAGNEDVPYLDIFKFYYNLYIHLGNEYISNVEFVERISNDKNFKTDYFAKKFTFPNSNPIWNFMLINRPIEKSSLEKLYELFVQKMHDLKIRTIDDLMTSEQIWKFRDIYISLPEFKNDLNLSSTMLLHYPSNKKLSSYFFTIDTYPIDLIRYFNKYYGEYPLFIKDYMERFGTITLLTGDISLDANTRDALKNELNKLDGAKILQIPHHGAYKNWKTFKNIKEDFIYSVISFGLGNKYYHPNNDTILDLKDVYGENRILLVNQIQGVSYIIF